MSYQQTTTISKK